MPVIRISLTLPYALGLPDGEYRLHRKHSSQRQNNGGSRNDNCFHGISRDENFGLKKRRTFIPKRRKTRH